jgi:hypothetical protein
MEYGIRLTVTFLIPWGALSDERMDLSFVCTAGPCQRSLSRVLVPWDLRPYFTVSDLRLPISSPPTTRRVTVEVFDPASTRVWIYYAEFTSLISLRNGPHRKHRLYCCNPFTETLHSNGRGTDSIESQSRDSHLAILLARWRLVTSYKHPSYFWVRLREMFIAPLPSYTRYNIILTSAFMSSGFLPAGFPTTFIYAVLIMRVHLLLLFWPPRIIWWRVGYKLWSSS